MEEYQSGKTNGSPRPSRTPLSLKKKQGNIAVIIHHQKHNSEVENGKGGVRSEDRDKNKKRYN